MTPLESKLSEMARHHNATTYGSKIDFKAGARAALNMPEVAELVEALKGLRKVADIGSDGTRIACSCNREGCHEFWCSAGDKVYVSSYANEVTPDEALAKWNAFVKGDEK